MAPPEEPARTPPDPEQRKDKRPWNWILVTALAAVVVIAGAILGAAELVSSHSSDSSGASQPPNISNNNTNQNTNKNGQSQSQQQGGQGQSGGQVQSQAVIVPYGQPFNQGSNLQQRVRIEINNTVTTGVKVFHLSGWYVLGGPCRYSAAAGGCTGRWFGTQRPPGYSQNLPPMRYRQQSSVPPQTNSPSAPMPSQQPPSSPPSATPSPQSSAQSSAPSFSTSALEQAVAAEQEQALAAAPSSSFDYTGPGSVAVTVSCTGSPTSSTTYDCTAQDGEGDSGTDVITVNADGTEWSDTGMTWTGPYVTSTTFVTPSVSDQAIPTSAK